MARGPRPRSCAALIISALWLLLVVNLSTGVAYADDTAPTADTSTPAADTSAPEAPPRVPHDRAAERTRDDDPAPGRRRHTDVRRAKLDTRITAAATADTSQDRPQHTRQEVGTHTSRPSRRPALTAEPSSSSGPRAVTAQEPAVAAPVRPAPPGPAPRPGQLTLAAGRMIGLASDAALLAVSLLNNVAAAVAATIGPRPFWGVPYRVATAVVQATGTAAKVLSGSPPDAVSTGPFRVDYGLLNIGAFFDPTKPPAGANDPSITVTAARPLPVILVNGTTLTQGINWSVGAPVLANAGYKVFTFNYGNTTSNPNFPVQGMADIRSSAHELADEVDRVLAETGAPKVILIGHSQGGGLLANHYINNLGGDAKVSQLIGIAPSNGTDVMGLTGLRFIPVIGPILFGALDLFAKSVAQQTDFSPLQDEVFGNGDTRPGVRYTTLITTHDWVLTPYQQQMLQGPAVTNIVLQQQFPFFPAGHGGIANSSRTWDVILTALAANPEASPLTGPTTVAA